MSHRLNITVPEPVFQIGRQAAEEQYEGNLSRLIADAIAYYVGRLEALEESPAPKSNNLD